MTASSEVVAVVGSINLDLTFRVPALPRPGETVLATDTASGPGGKGANQAVAAAAVGGRVEMIGAVGDDEAGRDTLALLARRGVGVDGVGVLAGASSGAAMVVVDDGGENLIVVAPGANARLDPAVVAKRVRAVAPAVILAQLEVPVAAVEAAGAARPDGALLVLNPAPIPPDTAGLGELLAMADVVVPNRSELGRLARRPEPTGPAEVDECVAALGFDGAVVVTLGADGAIVYDGAGGRHRVAPEAIEVVDTTGAGDAFCGVLACELATGRDLLGAVTVANRAAALATTFHGAQVPVGVQLR